MQRGAVLTRCGRFRALLARAWGPGPLLVAVGLNPSRADVRAEDATTRRLIAVARAHGFGRLWIVNTRAWRATDPAALATAPPDPRWVCAWRDAALEVGLRGANARLACWGARGPRDPAELAAGPWWVLGTTRAGHPRHPLYLPRSARLRRWVAAGDAPL
jgi:hypothetical protein